MSNNQEKIINHNKEKKYYEKRAQLLLEDLFDEFKNNLLLFDKPDIITLDNAIGIEVTRAISRNDAEKLSFYKNKLKKKSQADIDSEQIEKFCSDGRNIILKSDLGIEPSDEIVGYYTNATWHDNSCVKNSIKKKIEHINTVEYRKTNSLNLYVFSDSFKEYENYDMIDIVESIISFQKDFKKNFEYLYFDDCGWFYRCNLQNAKIEFYDTDKQIHNICVKAKQYAEKS